MNIKHIKNRILSIFIVAVMIFTSASMTVTWAVEQNSDYCGDGCGNCLCETCVPCSACFFCTAVIIRGTNTVVTQARGTVQQYVLVIDGEHYENATWSIFNTVSNIIVTPDGRLFVFATATAPVVVLVATKSCGTQFFTSIVLR